MEDQIGQQKFNRLKKTHESTGKSYFFKIQKPDLMTNNPEWKQRKGISKLSKMWSALNDHPKNEYEINFKTPRPFLLKPLNPEHTLEQFL